MKQERPHCHDITPASYALDHATLFAQGLGCFCGQATVPVRPRYDAERAIRGAAVIEVHAHGNERLQHGHRGLDVENAFLFGPAGTVAVRDTFLDRDTQILVQRDKPVVVCRFFEKRALNRDGALGKERPDLGVRFEHRRKPLADGNIE